MYKNTETLRKAYEALKKVFDCEEPEKNLQTYLHGMSGGGDGEGRKKANAYYQVDGVEFSVKRETYLEKDIAEVNIVFLGVQ